VTIAKKAILTLTAVILVLSVFFGTLYALNAFRQLNETTQQTATELREEVARLLRLTNSLKADQVDASMSLLKRDGQALGSGRQGAEVTVNGRSVPNLLLGDQPQANNFGLVDGLTRVMGGTATLFSRDGDDFVRISTNVMIDGQRAIGTILAPGGAAIKAINQGNAYYGQVDILGSPYITGYEPLLNNNGEVIGIWYVGYKADMQELEQAISSYGVLDSGFLALVDSRGQLRLQSEHVPQRMAEAVVTEAEPGWVVNQTSFDDWGYTIVSAYPRAELTSRIWDQIAIIAGAIVVASAVLVGIIFFVLRNMVSKPLGDTMSTMEQIAEGDFTVRLDNKSRDELGELARTFNRMLERLQSSLSDINSGSEQLSAAAEQLASLSIESDRAVEGQNAEISQVATAMNEMTVTVNEVANSTDQAAQAAADAKNEADNGNKVVEQTIVAITSMASEVDSAVEVIHQLSKASVDIYQVVKVINDIAEQTNLLALNAAIEAARAGENGRGFAVVADEVRSLAGRTQHSTQEIHTMIERLQTESKRAVEVMTRGQQTATDSVGHAEASRTSLERILVAVDRINDLNMEVASAAEQQSAVANEINRNITNISDASEHNKASSVQAMQSSEELAKLSKMVRNRLKNFKV
jgi:methyl-accepting chemotaxis protein